MLHMVVEEAFDDLLTRWREHHRRQCLPGVRPVYLAESRIQLDRARQRLHQFRVAMYPEPDEREEALKSVFCETLDSIVHLSWSSRDPMRPGLFVCPCGHTVPVIDR